jgi:predicted RNA binding protein YcfA (HicA-like mRNA interferase family)
MRKITQRWPASKSRAVLAALRRIGWTIKRQKGSHRTMAKPGWPNYVFAYHDDAEIGPNALKLLGEKTGLQPEDL